MRRIANLAIVFFIASSLSACITIPRSPDKAPVNLASYVDLQRFRRQMVHYRQRPRILRRRVKSRATSTSRSRIRSCSMSITARIASISRTAPSRWTTMSCREPAMRCGASRRSGRSISLISSYMWTRIIRPPWSDIRATPMPGSCRVNPKWTMPTYQSLLARFAAAGYDSSKLMKVPQFPEQCRSARFPISRLGREHLGRLGRCCFGRFTKFAAWFRF